MPISRRRFIKRGAGFVSAGVILPHVWLREARGQAPGAARKLVLIQLQGGNDGLNTLIPFTDPKYYQFRPTLALSESELFDAQGRSTILGGEPFGLHPSLGEMKSLYDAGKVAVLRGVGYPNPSLSHFFSMDIWHTADIDGNNRIGWLGSYADMALGDVAGLPAISVANQLPKAFFSDRVVIPNVRVFEKYALLTDPNYPGDRDNWVKTLRTLNSRTFPEGSFAQAIAGTTNDALDGAAQLQSSISGYVAGAAYPSPNPLADALKMVAKVITTVPEASLFYVHINGFDTHAAQIEGGASVPPNRLAGTHSTLLKYFSQGVKAFYDDLGAHGMADQTLIMQWSEFGRRPKENASLGTDHGTASVSFLIGNAVRGGLYGEQPSLADATLDSGGNMGFTTDFRSIYSTVVRKWLGADPAQVVGADYGDLGFLG